MTVQIDGSEKMTARRRALITNDDGIHGTGLRWLARAALEAGLEVVVAAPDYEASGSSAALTAIYRERRLSVTPADLGGDLPVEAYAVQASPGYVVMLAVIGTFGRPPDLVLSGINRGANTGHVVLHSGTVGAALTGANHGIAAMAVSLNVQLEEDSGGASISEFFSRVERESLHWATASEVARRALSTLDHVPVGMVLNVNVPNIPLSALAGVRQAKLAPFGHVQMAVAETGEGYVRTTVERATGRLAKDTDAALLDRSYATMTVVTSIQEIPTELDLSGLLSTEAGGAGPTGDKERSTQGVA
jgi:5'-nucleotidase